MAARLIILRHGEKPKGKNSALQLSPRGKQRAQALAQTHLGKGASRSLFGRKGPDAFFAITPHTVETASPSAESWGLPVTTFWASASGRDKNSELDARTDDAARKARRALGRGKTIVMIWEHKRIAGAAKPQTTLRNLLKLDRIDAVPVKWPDDDFDTIWIFACSGSGKPVHFESIAQNFQASSRPTSKTSRS
jgi:hypothetical protein